MFGLYLELLTWFSCGYFDSSQLNAQTLNYKIRVSAVDFIEESIIVISKNIGKLIDFISIIK